MRQRSMCNLLKNGMEKISMETLSGRISKVLFYADTRFYELLSGITMAGLIISIAIMGGSEGTVTSSLFGLVGRIFWGIFLAIIAVMQTYGSISKTVWPRVTGAILAMIFWLTIVIITLTAKGVIWPLFAAMAFNNAWVLFRVLIDRTRPLQGDII